MFKYKKLKEKVEMLQRIIEHSIPGEIGYWIESYKGEYLGYGSWGKLCTLYLYKDGKEFQFQNFKVACLEQDLGELKFFTDKLVGDRTVYLAVFKGENPMGYYILDLNNETYIQE